MLQEEQKQFDIEKTIGKLSKLKILNGLLWFTVISIFLSCIIFSLGIIEDITHYKNAQIVTVEIVDYKLNKVINENTKLVVRLGKETDTIKFNELSSYKKDDYLYSFNNTKTMEMVIVEDEDNSSISFLEVFGKHYHDYPIEEKINNVNSSYSSLLKMSIFIIFLLILFYFIDKYNQKRINILNLEKNKLQNTKYVVRKNKFVLKFIIGMFLVAIIWFVIMLSDGVFN